MLHFAFLLQTFFQPQYLGRVVSRAGLFGSGSGLKLTKTSGLFRAWDMLFVLGAQKYNQNNLATLLNFSDLS